MAVKDEIKRWQNEAVPMARKVVIGTILGLTIVPAITFSAGKAFGFWDNIVAIWRSPAAIAELTEELRHIRVPSEIFEVSERSGPPAGRCIEGQPCPMIVRARRFEYALACEIVPDSLTYYYLNPRTNEPSPVDIIRGTTRNLDTTWTNLSFTFSTPFGLSPDAEMCVKAKFRRCPGQIEGETVTQTDECFEVPVIR